MLKICAKYIAGALVLAAWLYTSHWAATSTSVVRIVAAVLAVGIAFTAIALIATSLDDKELERVSAGVCSVAFLTNFVFWSRIVYLSMWDWFAGPGILALVLGIVSGAYAVWSEVESDIASLRRGRSSVVDFKRRSS